MPLPQHLRLNAFKYPLAFIRIIQFVFVIIALASVNSWMYKLSYKCNGDAAVRSTDISTFSFDALTLKACTTDNKETQLWNAGEGYSSACGFFYFVNALALISLLGGAFFYVVLWEMYQQEGRARLADLALTALCFVLFFFCTSIWWSSSNNIGRATSEEHVKELLLSREEFWNGTVPTGTDALVVASHNGLLAISVLCGWACVVLFALNCWYIWKEIAPTPENDPTSIA